MCLLVRMVSAAQSIMKKLTEELNEIKSQGRSDRNVSKRVVEL